MKFIRFKYRKNPELYEQDCKVAYEILKKHNFNKKILQEVVNQAQADYGDAMIFGIVSNPKWLEEWAEKFDVSEEKYARDFLLMLTGIG